MYRSRGQYGQMVPHLAFILLSSAQSWNMRVSNNISSKLPWPLASGQRPWGLSAFRRQGYLAVLESQPWRPSPEVWPSLALQTLGLCYSLSSVHDPQSSIRLSYPYNPHSGPSLRNLNPVPSFLLSGVWPCDKNPSIRMLRLYGITSLRTSSNAILCSPLSQPSVPILASQFHCFVCCLFVCFCFCLFFLCFWFNFSFHFWSFLASL